MQLVNSLGLKELTLRENLFRNLLQSDLEKSINADVDSGSGKSASIQSSGYAPTTMSSGKTSGESDSYE